MKRFVLLISLCFAASVNVAIGKEGDPMVVRFSDGAVRGTIDSGKGIRSFKGIPYAAPPVGELRWKAPQALEPWEGVRDATEFGPRAMQEHIWDDMFFYDNGPSEDCLYLNVWTPLEASDEKLPVMFWIHGGGFMAGGTSEPRQEGSNLAKKGVVVVSVGYRMGVFGFMAHPELTEESPHHASGNYGLLDMVAALEWVQENIAAFGGDPENVTIFGESAGSFAVSLMMSSPLSKDLFHKAIAESGAAMGSGLRSGTLEEAEQFAAQFAEEHLGVQSLAELRALPGDKLLAIQWENARRGFSVCEDGYFLPKHPVEIFAAGEQSQVPLIAGWNLDEGGPGGFFAGADATLENYKARARELFGNEAAAFMAAYSATNDDEAERAAADYAGDQFIGYATWKLIEAHSATGNAPVYRYRFDQKLPLPLDAEEGSKARAAHSWEIEYVFDVLDSKDLPWREGDRKVASLMSEYWVNFAKSGNPNGANLYRWPRYDDNRRRPVLHIDATPSVEFDTHRERYEFLEARP